jgi:uncharacterized membrane protein
MSDWYYAANNEQKGPVNESELKADLAAGKIPDDTLVWKDGMDNWTPAKQVPAFSFRQPPVPAKVQPTATTPDGGATVKTVAATPGVNNPSSTTPINLKGIMGTPEALEVEAEDAENFKIFGILAYLGPLCFLPLVSAKDSPYAKYHANQGFVVLVLWIAISVLIMIVEAVFHTFGVFALDWILGLLFIVPLGLVVLGIINAAAGKCVPLPLIGGIKLIK